jgi:hypothetical protein
MAYDGMRNFGLFSQWFVSDLQIGEVGADLERHAGFWPQASSQ